MDNHRPAPLAPTKRAGRGVLVVLGLIAFVALAGVAGWLWLPRPAAPRRGPAAAAPEPAPTSTEPALHSSDPAPERGLWCAFADDVPLCGEGLTACERRRGSSRAPASPCERVTPSCFILDDPRDGKVRICTPTMGGCEQVRTGPIGRNAVTGCLPSRDDVVDGGRTIVVGVELPRGVYCSGEAPVEPGSCAATERACEAQRRSRDRAGRGDFGPCRIMP
jgi:hypothetical protein